MSNNTYFGFQSLQSLYNTRVQVAGPRKVYDAVYAYAAEYNRIANGMIGTLAQRTVAAKEVIALPSTSTLQPANEYTIPTPEFNDSTYEVAFPIYGGTTAWGVTRLSGHFMTVEEAAINTVEATRKDANWLVRHALSALLDNTTTAFFDKIGPGNGKGLGSLTVQPLANADGTLFPFRGAADFADDNHYSATSTAISDSTNANPFPALQEELREHPGNDGPYVAYVPTNLLSAVKALGEFIKPTDPNVIVGANTDRLATNGQFVLGFGDRVCGYLEDSEMWVVEASALPSNYIVALAFGATAPLAMREYDAPALQGFFPEQYVEENASIVNRFFRFAGFGVRNRLAAAVKYFGGSSYVIPTGYAMPQKV